MPETMIPRAHLFGNPSKISAQISPDGRLLAWLAPVNAVLNVWVAPVDALHEARPVTDDRKRGIRMYQWTYQPGYLVYLQDDSGDENFHVHAVELDTCTARDLTPFRDVQAWVAGVSRRVRDRILVSINRRDPRFHDLHTVDLATGAMSLIEENPGFASFVTDEHYTVHLAVRTTPGGGSEILHRPEGVWTPWFSFAPEDAMLSGPNNLDRDATTLFLRDSRGRNTSALTAVDLKSGGITLIAGHDKADIGALLIDQETQRPIAYSVETDRLEYFAIDPRLQPDLDFLAQQNIGDWYVSSRTEDDRYWGIGAHSDTRPSVEYLFDRESRSLRELHRARPELEGAPLRPMRPVTIKSRDGLDLVSYLTLPAGASDNPPQPMVLLVHGGPWARDTFGYNSVHQWLANRGYAVLSVNFRGSTGFGKAFVNAGDLEWGRRMDDDLLDAVAWAIDQRYADPQRIAIMGGSYGGYATLVGLTRNPDTYACGIDIVGPSNLETLIRTIPPYWEALRFEFLKAIGDPDTDEGRRLLRERSPLFQADRLARPLLIAQGANDPRVKQAESDQMVEALKSKNIPVTYLLFPDEGHGFARPENNIAFYAVAESFLARHLGGLAEPIHAEELARSTLEIKEGAAELSLPG